MAKVIIFGVMDHASLAHFYLKHDSDHEVAAFCVNEKYLPESREFEGLEVAPFEEVAERFPPGDFAFFAPMSHRRMSRLREQVYNDIKGKGYELVSYVSSRATIFPGTPVGDNCMILEDNTIQPGVVIGSDNVIWSGNHIGHHGRIMDHVHITSHVVLSGHCIVENNVFLGVNATVKQGTRLAQGTLVNMATVIAGDTEPWTVYSGHPAKKGVTLDGDGTFRGMDLFGDE